MEVPNAAHGPSRQPQRGFSRPFQRADPLQVFFDGRRAGAENTAGAAVYVPLGHTQDSTSAFLTAMQLDNHPHAHNSKNSKGLKPFVMVHPKTPVSLAHIVAFINFKGMVRT